MPITASPEPSSSPSRTEVATPAGSSVGWLGWSRVESLPGSPRVVRNAVVTRQAAPTVTRSWLRISLETAATISGSSPGPSRASVVAASGATATVSRWSRSSPTVIERIGAKASVSCRSRISRETSSVSGGTTCSSRKRVSGTSASACLAAARSTSLWAPHPARRSPDRAGLALPSRSTSPSNSNVRPARAWRYRMRPPGLLGLGDGSTLGPARRPWHPSNDVRRLAVWGRGCGKPGVVVGRAAYRGGHEPPGQRRRDPRPGA